MEQEYYHGGYPGLKVGEFVLPPIETGVKNASDFGAQSVHDKSKVYLTTSLDDAYIFAALAPHKTAAVYRVNPIGELLHDPDCSVVGLSFECEKAEVIEIRKIGRKEKKKSALKVLRFL